MFLRKQLGKHFATIENKSSELSMMLIMVFKMLLLHNLRWPQKRSEQTVTSISDLGSQPNSVSVIIVGYFSWVLSQYTMVVTYHQVCLLVSLLNWHLQERFHKKGTYPDLRAGSM